MHPPNFAEPRHTTRLLAAWCVSLLVHLAVMICGVLLIRPLAQLGGTAIPSRPVGIVLAAHTSEKAEYFTEDDLAETVETASASHASSASPAENSSGFPNSQSSPTSPEIALPGKPVATAEGFELSTADLSASRGGKRGLDSAALTAEILAAEALRPRAKLPAGEQGTVNLFGSGEMQGHSFVFLIDRSQSMGGQGLGAIAAAQIELNAALERLEENHTFQVVAYNQAPTYFQERKLIAVNKASRAACREFLENLAAFGATDHERALVSALHQLHPDVLYLLTDGDPALTPGQRQRIAAQAKGARICVLQFGRIRPDDEATQASLQALARENNGTYLFVDVNKL